jgi:hypothetical protein
MKIGNKNSLRPGQGKYLIASVVGMPGKLSPDGYSQNDMTIAYANASI